MAWQTIDSAPKDGRMIWLGKGGTNPCVAAGQWLSDYQQWSVQVDPDQGFGGQAPTYWDSIATAPQPPNVP